MKLSAKVKKELLRLSRSRKNRVASDLARKYSRCRTFDEYIAALDDLHASFGTQGRRDRAFVPYTFFPF